jgi:sucrose-6-phosphate hydrolase SacC (GH32 family)
VYSGSVVLDACTVPPRLTAYYTSNRASDGGMQRQTQECSISADGGRTFAPPARSPLIDAGLANFRDPFVRLGPDDILSMLVARPADWNATPADAPSCVDVYRPDADGHWLHRATIGPWDPAQVLWEVPWVVDLKRDDGQVCSVLVISIVDRRGGAVRCSVRYWVGTFDGCAFTPEPGGEGLALDHGPDYYAPIPATPVDEDAALTIAWVGNWAYSRQLRAAKWAGGPMSLPQRMTLHRTAKGTRLRRTPVALDSVRGAATRSRCIVSSERRRVAEIAPPCDVTVRLDLGSAESVTLHLFDSSLRVTLDEAGRRVTFTRAPCALAPEAFAGSWSASREPASPELELRLLIDTCTVEAFADDGQVVFTLLLFPESRVASLLASAAGGEAIVAAACRALVDHAGQCGAASNQIA